MNTRANYALIPVDAGVPAEYAELQTHQAELQTELRLVREDLWTHQVALYAIAAVVVGTLVLAWLRGREASRIHALLKKQSGRLDAQDKRISAAVREIASERARLHEAVDVVAIVGGELKTDLAASVRLYQDAARSHADVMAESEKTVLALITQLQRVAQGVGNVQA